MLATKMIKAIPHIPLFTNDATPEKIVSSMRRPLVIRMDMGIKFAGKLQYLPQLCMPKLF